MLLAVDIGNTTIKLGVFDGDKLKTTWQLATGIDRLADEYGALLLTLIQSQKLPASKITGVALCSVVPPLVSVFQQVCQKYLGLPSFIVEAGVKTGLRICMDNPRELGPDRVSNAVAARHLYGEPVIVIDLGTATTFDVVSRQGDYIGGAIAPGIGIASEALFTRTAALPRIGLTRPKQVVGTNTIAAMQSGIFFGYIGLIESMLQRIGREMGDKARVVATGGYAYLAKEIPVIEVVNPDLPLIGLRLIYAMNKVEDD